MIFNSLTFLVFLLLVFAIFWSLNRQWKNLFLLIVSCIFYGFWRWEYLIVMFVSAFTDYYTSLMIYNTPESNIKKRRFLLFVTLAINLGMLFYFKYLYFVLDNSNSILALLDIDYRFTLYHILLPFGISFYTFETISYTVDVYRGVVKPEKSFLNYALFVTFFPKLVAGPIQRASELIPQFNQKYKLDIDAVAYGLKRILHGLFLKVVLADNVAGFVEEAYAMNYSMASAIDVFTLAFLFGFQIYFDFSAYSHIALGAARLFNIQIPENFDFPYMATSLKAFWKRWHISLSAWIRDYLYLPISGVSVTSSSGKSGIGASLDKNRNQRSTVALFVTWAIMGFWHGANWTFLFWGLYHATSIYIERKLVFLRESSAIFKIRFVNWGITLIVVMLSWIPFRTKTLSETFTLYGRLFNYKNYTYLSLRENAYILCFCLILFIVIVYGFSKYFENYLEKYTALNYGFSLIKYTIMVFLIIVFLRPINQFIYFQF
jgi:D-alanyl-lipoteichoic acid acyltransferase DltB (MBOAT superfamily)